MAIEVDVDLTEQNKISERDEEIEKLMNITAMIISEAASKTNEINNQLDSRIVNMEVSDEISTVLRTVFTCLSKEHDTNGDNKYLDYKAKVWDVEINIRSIVDKIKSRGIQINFPIATPIVEVMTLYKASFNEVRTGVARFRVRTVGTRGVKRDAEGQMVWKPKEITQNIFQYGLTNHHIPLLQGITFAPKRRTEVLRSLGPLTQAILLVIENKSLEKLTSALMNSIHMLPMAQYIVNCLRDATSPGAVTGVLKELGDILLLTTHRFRQFGTQYHFPLLMLYIMWKDRTPGTKWSFSGSDVLKLYNASIDKGMQFHMRTGADGEKASEVVFHAMFGTYLKDLGVLSEITSKESKWHQRKDLNDVFINRATREFKLVPLIKFKMISKMEQSLQTKSLGMTTSRPSFSGYRRRIFTQEFLNYLSTGNVSQSFSDDPIQLLYALIKTKEKLIEDKDNTRLLKATAASKIKWEAFAGGEWKEVDTVPTESGYNFFRI